MEELLLQDEEVLQSSRMNKWMKEPANVVTGPQQTTNARTKLFVSSMNEFPVVTSANRTKWTFSDHQPINTNKAASHKQN